ncbi:imidazole glycerol phosphate synthase subunit HisH [Janthinobacterium sp. PC23-8]|uniref:imidazole glycerol phosphate synthase subunit HisH n=1 Tax=Janthinobacterium sp. PC23-8 TaxID=2012679 RepID=UPI000B961B4A|nr:imidazole glycerol phosphate synthase subunit HisH [Janthinobacterium sp. PC23-8]OYO31191.1 imidazole glycerol phosphate synthase subunit HisH [Janthinobacterium sp. PC23-8]
MIHIVDYGLGNVQAFANMYKRLGFDATRAKTAAELTGATKIILPGVGAFDKAMELLDASGMRPVLEDLVVEKKVPVLGICVGMQILASASDEGTSAGLGWIPGRVRSFGSVEESSKLPLPHMGWNDVAPGPGSALFAGLEADARFYFLHSFFFDSSDPAHVSARATYGLNFGCAVSSGNVHGVQFHPEKSHHYGALLLKNFAEL